MGPQYGALCQQGDLVHYMLNGALINTLNKKLFFPNSMCAVRYNEIVHWCPILLMAHELKIKNKKICFLIFFIKQYVRGAL